MQDDLYDTCLPLPLHRPRNAIENDMSPNQVVSNARTRLHAREKHREVQPSVPLPKASSHVRDRVDILRNALIRGCGIPRCDTAGTPIGEPASPCLEVQWRP